MAGDELPKVPAFEPPDRAGKHQRPPTYPREKLKKSDQKPQHCAIRHTVLNELNKDVPLPPKPPIGLEDAQQVGYWHMTRNMKVVTTAIDLGVQGMFAEL